MATTTRWGIPYPALTSAADVPQWMHDLAVSLDDVAKDDQGLLGSRPSAGKRGSYYYATDTTQLFRDNGSAWQEIQLGSIAKADLATDALNAFLKLASAGDHKVAFGSGDSTNGSSWGISAQASHAWTHGLGTTPLVVLALASPAASTASSTDPVVVNVTSKTSTTFTLQYRTLLGGNCNFPGVNVDWVAIG